MWRPLTATQKEQHSQHFHGGRPALNAVCHPPIAQGKQLVSHFLICKCLYLWLASVIPLSSSFWLVQVLSPDWSFLDPSSDWLVFQSLPLLVVLLNPTPFVICITPALRRLWVFGIIGSCGWRGLLETILTPVVSPTPPGKTPLRRCCKGNKSLRELTSTVA